MLFHGPEGSAPGQKGGTGPEKGIMWGKRHKRISRNSAVGLRRGRKGV